MESGVKGKHRDAWKCSIFICLIYNLVMKEYEWVSMQSSEQRK